MSADTGLRLAEVRERISQATEAAGRTSPPRLIAVSKTHGPERVSDLRAHGVHDFGENRVQELVAKRAVVGESDDAWHLIGPLQRSKVNNIVGTGALIHTVDRRSLVDKCQRHCAAHGRRQRVLVQVNVADDPAKRGCRLDQAADLVAYIADTADLIVEGLMTMAPFPDEGQDPNERSRPHFRHLRELGEDLRTDHPGLTELSMGMSGDLEAAIAEGATMVRVGTALLGPRGPRPWEPLDDPTTTLDKV